MQSENLIKYAHAFCRCLVEADLRAGPPTVKKNMSVPKITAVLTRPARDAIHIQWFIAHPPFLP
jgi:hypothetical protein